MSSNVVILDRFQNRPRISNESNVQLTFEFYQVEHNKMTIAVMDTVHGIEFCDIVSELRPKVVLDMRRSVRFDLPGSSRSHIFRQFSKNGTLYSRASLKWHDLTPSDFMLGENSLSIRLKHELLEREESPLLILVQKSSHAQLLHSFVNRQLQESGKDNWLITHCG